MKYRLLAVVAATLAMQGCGALVPIQAPESAAPSAVEAAKSMATVNAEAAKSLKSLGEVVGYSCKNKLWDPAATADAATAQVKLIAAQRGATAIGTPTCTEGGTSLGMNCWQSFTCRAPAYR